MTNETAFLLIWIDFTVMALAAVAASVIWGVKAKQFRNQDYARYLPLKSGIPEQGEEGAKDPNEGGKNA
jgi:hypothetical protein